MQGWTDSESALTLQERGYVKFDKNHMRTDFQTVKDALTQRLMTLQHMSGKLNPADVLTKPLAKEAHERYTKFLLNAESVRSRRCSAAAAA